mgnify:FL=1
MKIISLVLVFLVVSVYGCQPQVQEDDTQPEDGALKAGEDMTVEVS